MDDGARHARHGAGCLHGFAGAGAGPRRRPPVRAVRPRHGAARGLRGGRSHRFLRLDPLAPAAQPLRQPGGALRRRALSRAAGSAGQRHRSRRDAIVLRQSGAGRCGAPLARRRSGPCGRHAGGPPGRCRRDRRHGGARDPAARRRRRGGPHRARRVAVRRPVRRDAARRTGRGTAGRGRVAGGAGAPRRYARGLRAVGSPRDGHRRWRWALHARHAAARRRVRGDAAARRAELYLPGRRRGARIRRLRGDGPPRAARGAHRRRLCLSRVHGARSPRRDRWWRRVRAGRHRGDGDRARRQADQRRYAAYGGRRRRHPARRRVGGTVGIVRGDPRRYLSCHPPGRRWSVEPVRRRVRHPGGGR